jgi:hypothetical protein
MPFDLAVALHLVSDERTAEAEDKIEMEFEAMVGDWTSDNQIKPARAAALRKHVVEFHKLLKKLVVELDIDDELVAFFKQKGVAEAVDQQWRVKAIVDPDDTKEAAAEKQKRLEHNIKLLAGHLDEFARFGDWGELLDLVDLLHAVRAPSLFCAPLANAAFECLHSMREAERRAAIDMPNDTYDNPLLYEMAVARSAWAVDKCSGTLTPEAEPANAADAFAWPTDDSAEKSLPQLLAEAAAAKAAEAAKKAADAAATK